MPWSGNDGGQQGPWGSAPKPPQPPDVEKVIQMAKERLSGRMPQGGRSWPFLGGLAFIFWMGSGIYTVAPDEQGVVLRFGKFQEVTTPGPHFHLPYPIESVYKPKVTQVQRIEIGYRSRNRNMADVPVESLMLTGDENIIDIDMSVQFQIKDAVNFLFEVRNPSNDPDKMVRDAAETAIRQVIGRNSIDEALTSGKEKIQAFTKQTMQEILDSYTSGIQIIGVQLQQVAPPSEVIHAFKDVASAREDRERAINEAQGYANDILPRANGEASRIIQEAEAYKKSKRIRAEGDVARFSALYEEYSKAKDITEARIYLETMEEVLSNVHKVIMESGNSSGVLPYLPLDRMRKHDSGGQGGGK
ncbi:MAG: FtsH protease activity modulator HflK [Magnetococcales bacterium]|nr:FtsH protease activity modulator HflK [Magnetococcales bacterium]NGZ26153.1 FtsH protease activity modulator HflK [Magnetococcales bacterium]